jgi:CoA:oxalate CoA-transferase
MERALQGIRVLDLSHVLAAPTATMILADLGAEVIHIEPPQGDDARDYGPYVGGVDKNRSAYFISLNRNKKSMVLNLKYPKGKKILEDLIKVSDVIVENFRPDTMKSLGFGWEAIHSLNPRIIFASISGFGRDTLPEYDNRPAYDVVAQAYSGLMSITGPEGGPPCRVGSSMGDIMAGHQAAIGILTALFYRQKTGVGQYYDGAMVDGLFAVLENAVVRYMIEKKIPGPLGTAHPSITPFQALQTKDRWIIIPIGSDKLWTQFCELLGRVDLIRDPRFTSNAQRAENRRGLIEILEGEMRKKTAAEWVTICEKNGIPYSLVNDIQQICEDPHIAYREMLVEVDQPGMGKLKIVGSPLRLSETPGQVYARAPLLGEHTAEVLSGILGLSAGEIAALKAEGVINKT